jgi:hypothetical protein
VVSEHGASWAQKKPPAGTGGEVSSRDDDGVSTGGEDGAVVDGFNVDGDFRFRYPYPLAQPQIPKTIIAVNRTAITQV